jgi:hypothetical protein
MYELITAIARWGPGVAALGLAALAWWSVRLARHAIELCEQIRDRRDMYRRERDALAAENTQLRSRLGANAL